jgi:pyruvate dehydrogenase (quinone)
MPPKIAASQVFGTALYGAKAVLGGRARDVVSLIKENLLN